MDVLISMRYLPQLNCICIKLINVCKTCHARHFKRNQKIDAENLKIREKTKDFDAHETARHAHSANFREIPFLLSENF